jgi:hypothetical protein
MPLWNKLDSVKGDASLTGTEQLSEDEFADQVAAIAEQLTAVVQEFR